MALRHFRLFAIASTLVATAVSWIVAIPDRAVSLLYGLVDFILDVSPQAIADFLRQPPAPALAILGPPGYADVSLLNSQRHEAGLARLGAVRHNC